MEIDLHVHGLVDRDLQELVLETELCLFLRRKGCAGRCIQRVQAVSIDHRLGKRQTFWAFSQGRSATRISWKPLMTFRSSTCGDAGSGDPHRHLLVPRPSRLEGATRRFDLLLESKLLDEAKQQLRTDLLCYYDQDTLGLVKLVDRLLELARGSGVLR